MILGHALRRIVLIVLLLSMLVPATVAAQSQALLTGVRGQSVTLLPDGRWLLLGGEGVAGPVGMAEIRDPRDGSVVHLATGLAMPRAWHTATVLSDGSVLVLGGIGPAGSPFAAPELLDRDRQTFHPITIAGLTPRAQHSATLLTDGTVLIAGGVSAGGDVRDDAELIDLHDGPAATATGPMTRERQGHGAWLRPDGGALLWGGLDRQGVPRPDGDLFDPERERFGFATGPPLVSIDPPSLVGSIPQDGAIDVSPSGLIALRFSKPVRVETVTPLTVFLTGPLGLEPAQVVAAEGGALAFVTPRTLLETGSAYTVSINGVRDDAGFLVPPTAVQFTTASPPPAAMNTTASAGSQTAQHDHGRGADDEHGHRARVTSRPGGGEIDDPVWRGPMKDDKPYSPWQDLPPLRAPDGVTALSGQVFRLNGQPLADVTLSIGTIEARTDHTGRFLLRDMPAGRQVLVMDGSTANRRGRTYGTFVYGLPIMPRQTTVLPFTIWMPLLDMANAVELPVPTTQDMVITTPRVPGLEMRIPGGVTLQLADGPLTVISLTRIPVDRTPFPLPPGTTFFYTPQGHGAQVQLSDGTASPRGVSFILPNLDQLSPGSRVALQTSTPSRGWYVYGYGTVSADGQQILPDPGLEMHRVLCASGLGGSVQFAGPVPGGLRATDPVDLATGLFTYEKTDLVLPDVIPIVLRRSHRGGDAGKRTFGVGAADDYSLYLVGDYSTYQWAELMLPDGGRVRFSRVSPGTDKTSAVFEHTATPTRWYKARLAYNSARPGFDLTLTTQWRYEFTPYNAYRGPGNVLTAIQDPHGNRLTIERANVGCCAHPYLNLPQRITSPNGRLVEFTVDTTNANDVVLQARDVHGGRTVSYTYDSQFRLATVTDAAGGVTSFTYDGTSQRIRTITDPRSLTYLTNEYNANGRVTRQTQADGTIWELAYTLDGQGKVTQTDVTDPRGTVRRVTFDAAGYPLTDTRAYGQAEAQTITYQRDTTTHVVTWMTDALGRTTAYTYDSMGNVTAITRLSGTADAVTTTFTYEPTFNQVASATDPLNHTTSFTYDGSGNLTTITDPLTQATTLTYNSAGQPLTITDALSHTVQLTYDRGDLVSITDPLGNVTTRFTDAIGRVVAITSALGQRTRYAYDALNQVTAITDALAGMTQFSYDGNGNLLSVTDARTNATTYAYNSMDRATTRTDPLTHAETYAYDNNGNVATFTERKSQASTSTYDRLDRLTQISYADSSTTSFTWDAGNRLTQVADSLGGTITRTYDGLDRLTQETTPQGTISYTYDGAGRRTTMTVAGQATVTYSYDAANRLTGVAQATASVGLGYDAASRRTLLTLPNGTSTEYSYDAASRLTGLTYKAGTTMLGTLTYSSDTAGNRTAVGGTWARTGQPAALTGATYNAANQQVTFGGQTLTYDLNGNLTSDGTNTYSWNARNQLVGVTGSAGPTFGYDGTGRRQTKTINGTATSFLHDGVNPVQEQTGSSVINFLTGLGIDEFYMRTDAAGSQTYFTDVLGSTVALTDASAAVQATYTYEAFGTTTGTGTTSNSYDFTGREADGPGLKYYRARYYLPGYQRFIAEDPLGFIGGDPNLYAYVFDSPVSLTDPTGEVVPVIAAGVACAAGAIGGVAVVLSGRKPTPLGIAIGAAVGCVGGLGVLSGWGLAAGAISTTAVGANAVAVTAGVSGAAAGGPRLPAVPSAVGKLGEVASKFGTTAEALIDKAMSSNARFIDTLPKNYGNVNVFLPRPDGGAGFVRVTLDPSQSLVISGGMMRAGQVGQGIVNGRFVP